jgi:hypothetical protein
MHGTEDRFSQKHNGYITRKAKEDYYGWFCTQTCLLKFIKINIEQIINFVGKKDSPSVRKMGELQYYELRDSFFIILQKLKTLMLPIKSGIDKRTIPS